MTKRLEGNHRKTEGGANDYFSSFEEINFYSSKNQ